jgi:zinc D-Ala-D-Ala carboxypeptidase
MFIPLLWCAISGSCLVMGRESLPDPALQRVTKKVSLESYMPSDLGTFKGIRVSKRIIPDLEKLLAAARKDGLALKVMSGYRGYEKQVQLFKRYVNQELQKNPRLTLQQAEERANRYSARPGHSEHQLGTTVDVLSSENGYQFSADKSLKYVGWLEKNVHKYHFKISYPEGSQEYEYEPWHLRWYP